jgi:hypothetical protein
MASRLIDNLIAVRLLYMLVTPFDKTEAYKLGIIDANGKILRKASSLTTPEEKDAYNYLSRLVFNVKRLINKLPGGESKLKNIVAAYYLVKESYQNKKTIINEQEFMSIVEKLETITLVEEEIFVEKFLNTLEEEGEGSANVTGAGVSTDEPVVKKKDVKKYRKLTRRSAPMNVPC